MTGSGTPHPSDATEPRVVALRRADPEEVLVPAFGRRSRRTCVIAGLYVLLAPAAHAIVVAYLSPGAWSGLSGSSWLFMSLVMPLALATHAPILLAFGDRAATWRTLAERVRAEDGRVCPRCGDPTIELGQRTGCDTCRAGHDDDRLRAFWAMTLPNPVPDRAKTRTERIGTWAGIVFFVLIGIGLLAACAVPLVRTDRWMLAAWVVLLVLSQYGLVVEGIRRCTYGMALQSPMFGRWSWRSTTESPRDGSAPDRDGSPVRHEPIPAPGALETPSTCTFDDRSSSITLPGVPSRDGWRDDVRGRVESLRAGPKGPAIRLVGIVVVLMVGFGIGVDAAGLRLPLGTWRTVGQTGLLVLAAFAALIAWSLVVPDGTMRLGRVGVRLGGVHGGGRILDGAELTGIAIETDDRERTIVRIAYPSWDGDRTIERCARVPKGVDADALAARVAAIAAEIEQQAAWRRRASAERRHAAT